MKMPVPSQKSERSCICVYRVSLLLFTTIFLLDFELFLLILR